MSMFFGIFGDLDLQSIVILQKFIRIFHKKGFIVNIFVVNFCRRINGVTVHKKLQNFFKTSR